MQWKNVGKRLRMIVVDGIIYDVLKRIWGLLLFAVLEFIKSVLLDPAYRLVVRIVTRLHAAHVPVVIVVAVLTVASGIGLVVVVKETTSGDPVPPPPVHRVTPTHIQRLTPAQEGKPIRAPKRWETRPLYWERCAKANCSQGGLTISRIVKATYVPTKADVGGYIGVRDTDGLTIAVTSARVKSSAPYPIARPTVRVVDGLAVATRGRWDGASAIFTAAWHRCALLTDCKFISGSKDDRMVYAITPRDIGYYLQVRITARNQFGSSTAQSLIVFIDAPDAPS